MPKAAWLLVPALLLAQPAPVAAQAQAASKGDVALSYSILRDGFRDGVTLPTGWVVAVAARLCPRMSAVGEVGGNYKTENVLGTNVRLNIYSYQGGIRYGPCANRKYSPFGQLLAGAARATGTPSSPALLSDGLFIVSKTGFSVQPGVGVDIKMFQKINARVQADYRYIRSQGQNASQLRFAFGAAFGF